MCREMEVIVPVKGKGKAMPSLTRQIIAHS